MDPIHLMSSEIEYELMIRGALNRGTARQKTNWLRELMLRESEGEEMVSLSVIDSLDFDSELSVCRDILENISETLRQADFNPLTRTDCRSRLLHIISRLKRIDPTLPVCQLVEAAESKLKIFSQELVERSGSQSTEKSRSPLADAIEMIHLSRSSTGHSPNPIDRPVRENVNFSSKARRSLLNPTVPDFVPVDGAVGGSDQVQLPARFDRPPPAYSGINPIATYPDRVQTAIQRETIPVVVPNRFESAQREFVSNVQGRSGLQAETTKQAYLSSVPYTANTRFGPRNDFLNPFQGRQVECFQQVDNSVVPETARAQTTQNSILNNFQAQRNQYADTNRQAAISGSFPRHHEEPMRNVFPSNIRSQAEATNRRAPLAYPAGEPVFDREFRYPLQQLRKSVPVHQWKISFSGEGHGLHLYDFLSELQMFQRSEGVTDNQIFSSVVHLLTGRARLWYRSWVDSFESWDELVTAMKTEFLPPKSDFKLLASISNRRQKQTETFAEYLTLMQSLFKHLTNPVSEQYKLCIIEENMLTKYAIATSVLEIRTIDQLSQVCRRVDYAYAKSPPAVPFERGFDQRNFVRGQNQNRSRALNLVEAMHQPPNDTFNFPGLNIGNDEVQCEAPLSGHKEQPQSDEILEMRRARYNNNSVDPNQERRECYNCRRVGHSFSACPSPQKGQFCFRCGSRDVTTFNCRNCAKNGGMDSDAQQVAPNPQNN